MRLIQTSGSASGIQPYATMLVCQPPMSFPIKVRCRRCDSFAIHRFEASVQRYRSLLIIGALLAVFEEAQTLVGAYLSPVAWIGPMKPLSELTMDVVFHFA